MKQKYSKFTKESKKQMLLTGGFVRRYLKEPEDVSLKAINISREAEVGKQLFPASNDIFFHNKHR